MNVSHIPHLWFMLLIQEDAEMSASPDSSFRLDAMPRELRRALRMVAARREVSLRAWVLQGLYRLVDEELADWPQWRFQTEPGEEMALILDGRRSSGRRRGAKKAKSSVSASGASSTTEMSVSDASNDPPAKE